MGKVTITMEDYGYLLKFWEKLEKNVKIQLEPEEAVNVRAVKRELEKKLLVPGASRGARIYMDDYIESNAEGFVEHQKKLRAYNAKKEAKEAGRKSSSKASINPPTGGTYQEGSVIKLNEGTVKVVKYRFYPDDYKVGITIELLFTPFDHILVDFESTRFHWMQTNITNTSAMVGNDVYQRTGRIIKRLDLST